jgi:phosphohistidine phosphatase
MKIYFLRHGLATDRSEWKDDDALRPLTEEGKDKIARTAATISKLDLGLDVILSSPFVRAYQTAEIVAQKLGLDDKLIKDDRLVPGLKASHLVEILHEQSHAQAIMLVGHEPDFSDTISGLVGGGRIVCKKGGLALVELEHPGSAHGKLIWLLPPRVLTM